MTAMIKLRHQQTSLWHRGLAEDIEGLWEPWMRLVAELLEDEGTHSIGKQFTLE
jgi:hypothetical protein